MYSLTSYLVMSPLLESLGMFAETAYNSTHLSGFSASSAPPHLPPHYLSTQVVFTRSLPAWLLHHGLEHHSDAPALSPHEITR